MESEVLQKMFRDFSRQVVDELKRIADAQEKIAEALMTNSRAASQSARNSPPEDS